MQRAPRDPFPSPDGSQPAACLAPPDTLREVSDPYYTEVRDLLLHELRIQYLYRHRSPISVLSLTTGLVD